MNVREILWGVPINYPTVKVREAAEDDRSPDWNWFRLDLPNGWRVSCGYGREHHSDGRHTVDPKDAVLMEIALFTPEGEWHIAEGMTVIEPPPGQEGSVKTGSFSFQTSDQLFRIVDYLMALESKPP